MNIAYELYPRLEDKKLRDQVWNILCGCDKEFVPALSARESSFQNELGQTEVKETHPFSYFNEMINQVFILAKDLQADQTVGFMSFRHSYVCEELAGYSPSNYITTVCVSREWRRHGITREFYRVMLEQLPEELELKYITTRTWSTNFSHIHILRDIGFHEVTKLVNHRGNQIDTNYFGFDKGR